MKMSAKEWYKCKHFKSPLGVHYYLKYECFCKKGNCEEIE